jgi:hypothetical protein
MPYVMQLDNCLAFLIIRMQSYVYDSDSQNDKFSIYVVGLDESNILEINNVACFGPRKSLNTLVITTHPKLSL